MAKGSYFIPAPLHQPAAARTGRERLAHLVTSGTGPRTCRQSGAGVHADQHRKPNRERDRSAARRAAIARDLDGSADRSP